MLFLNFNLIFFFYFNFYFILFFFKNIFSFFYAWFYNFFFIFFKKKDFILCDLPTLGKSRWIFSFKFNSLFSFLQYYTLSFFAGAWYLDIFITKFAFYICSSSLNIFYYVIDKGFIYFLGPEGWASFFLTISKFFASVQCGIISKYLFITIFSTFLIFFFIFN